MTIDFARPAPSRSRLVEAVLADSSGIAKMSPMRRLADESRVEELIHRLADVVAQDIQQGAGPWALVGIRSRGDLLADRIAQTLPDDALIGVGAIDITLYRDDLSEIGPQPIVRTTEIDFPIDGVNIVLIDDVMMTGRSIRAALQSLMDFGRPARVWLVVLADRGGRELPICPDHVGVDLKDDLEPGEKVKVTLRPDHDDGIWADRPPDE